MYKHLLEYLSHRSIWGVLLLLAGGLTWLWPQLGAGTVWLAIGAGALLFFITEYTTHRFLFHAKPPQNSFLLGLMKQLHYDHHEDPNDLHHLFLPIWYSLINYSVLFGITYWLFGSPVIATAVVCGGLLALLYYEWVHYAAHRPVKLFTPWAKWMKKYHLVHHYQSEHYWFGVTNPVLDIVFGTRKNRADVELSPTARNLLQDQEKRAQ